MLKSFFYAFLAISLILVVQTSTQEISEKDLPEGLNDAQVTGTTPGEAEDNGGTGDPAAETPEAPNQQGTSEFTTIDNILLPSYLLVTESPAVATESPAVATETVASQNTTAEQTNATQKHVQCTPKMGASEVEIVNGTTLIKLLMPDTNVTSKDAVGSCVVVLFYATYCPFSSMAAPHFNALPRAFPDVKMVAIDAMKYHFFNAQNGIGGVPTLFLFHNGRPVSKFNESDYTLELFSKFITKHTGIKAEEKSYVTSADFSGPVSSVPEKDTDYYLGLSWAFILACSVYYFSKSKWWEWIVETVQITWRESEAQHEHNE